MPVGTNRELYPDITFLQVDLFVEEHVGNHLEVGGVVGDKEEVFAAGLGVQQVVFGEKLTDGSRATILAVS